ncbi:LacI family DNA-binding transcriptional regulator [Dictyobacter aurantiacus]|uniref:Lac repressor n=1 Tax=Dictyobacter aurantiacus TaxID=1936993 RepID=A0A401ZGU8_9CHLR|nr:LacI family DNA-binding transcriptional regulator [Dictyobacter aurantiacus]GCE06110.1 lac repressor [Dictyobacter aurantiacus]
MVVKKKKSTIRDVAKLAGVSYQTVSRVMNESESVAEETRRRVLQAMKELDFVPSKVARMLTTHRSHTLELVVVSIRHGGRFAESIKSMALAARDAGYDLLVTMTTREELGAALENAAARLVDGVIMHAPSLDISDEDLLEIAGGMPLVRRDYVPTSKLAWVGFDQIYATRMAVEYLIKLGHRQIAAIPPTLDLINGHLRHTVWRETLLHHGLQPGPMCASQYTFTNGHAAMQQLLASGQPFTAVMVGSDTMALGAMRALREHGLRIPADVSVISFDNAELAAYTEPPLTTIDFNFGQQDTTAVKYLIEILNNPDMKLHQRILLPDLIVRESTGEAPAGRVAEHS